MRYILLLFIIILPYTYNAQGNDKKELDSLFQIYDNSGRLFGSFELMKENKTIYNNYTGYQNIKLNKKNDSLTVYPIMWLKELYTMAIVLQLEEEGKLSLSNKLSQYYKEIPNSKDITLLSLLKHQSGLGKIDILSKVVTKDELIKYFNNNSVSGINKENIENKYSNADYHILRFIIEDITGKSYKEELYSRIIDKLGLKNTFYQENIDKNRMSQFYSYANNQWKLNYNRDNPTEGIYSNVRDLSLFISALYQGELFSNKQVNKYIKIKDRKNRIALNYINEDKTDKYYLKGSYYRINFLINYFEKEKMVICILSNGNNNMDLSFISSALFNWYSLKPIKYPNLKLIDKWRSISD